MTDLIARFPRKQWKSCCGKGCAKCAIAQAYIAAYGKKKDLKRLNEDRDAVSGAKPGKKGKKAANHAVAGGKKDKTSTKTSAKK